MKQPFAHAMMPLSNHDEQARQDFILSFKIHMEDEVYPENKTVYRNRVLPEFVRAHNREPETRQEVRRAMEQEPFTQMWGSVARTLQELMWANVGDTVERQLPELIERSKDKKKPLGTLTLDPEMVVPGYNASIDIHCMPGGYHTDTTEDDVFAGGIYDRGAYYYVAGLMGKKAHEFQDKADSLFLEYQSRRVIDYLRREFPNLAPKRILDMGCGTGNSTLPYTEIFPDAEVYGVDLGAPVLRYGHARAEGFGRKAHFAQQNAEGTNFPDGYFDLVVSHGLCHETSGKAVRNILKEAHRLLAPGGVTLHADPQFSMGLDLHDSFMHDWDTHYNAEPFWGTLHDIPPKKLMTDAGFAQGKARAVWMVLGPDGKPAYPDVLNDPSLTSLSRGIIFGAAK